MSQQQGANNHGNTAHAGHDALQFALAVRGYLVGQYAVHRWTQYDSDFLTNKEIGFKATKLMDGKLNLNGTYSVMDWEDFQTTTWDPDISAFSFTGNIGNAEIKGLEMNAYYSATDSLFFYLGVAKYDSSIVSDYSIGQFSVVPAGTPLPRTPDMKTTLYANYSFAFRSFDADASISVVKVGSANTTLFPATN